MFIFKIRIRRVVSADSVMAGTRFGQTLSPAYVGYESHNIVFLQSLPPTRFFTVDYQDTNILLLEPERYQEIIDSTIALQIDLPGTFTIFFF
jgi:hypothetical protein